MSGLADAQSRLHFASVGSVNPVGQTYKRVIDVTLAVCGIVLLAPLLLICYLATIISSPGPALFRHQRIGFKGKPFECLYGCGRGSGRNGGFRHK